MINNTLKNNQAQTSALQNFANKTLGLKPKMQTGVSTPYRPPVQPVAQSVVQKPVTSTQSSSIGSYKGTPLYQGEDVASRMREIDNAGLVKPTEIKQVAPVGAQTSSQQTVTQQPVTQPRTARGLFSDVASSLYRKGTEQNENVRRAQEEYQKSVNALQAFKESVAETKAGIRQDPVSARVMQGREAALQQANAEKLAAYQTAVQQTQEGIGFAQEQQSLEQQALQQAGALAQPVQIAPGSTLASPLGGETIAGGIGGYANYQTAEQVMGLISQYPDAGYIYNPELTPQQNLQNAQSAIQRSPTYQRSTFGAPGAGSYLGGAQLQTAAELTGQVAGIEASATGAEANFDLLVNLARQGGVNNTNVPILNSLQQGVARGTTSNEAVATFQAIIQTVRAQYAQILGGGTTTVESLNEAKSIIPDDVSIAALETLSKNLKIDAQNRIAGYKQQIQTLSGQTPATTGGGTFSW